MEHQHPIPDGSLVGITGTIEQPGVSVVAKILGWHPGDAPRAAYYDVLVSSPPIPKGTGRAYIVTVWAKDIVSIISLPPVGLAEVSNAAT